METITAKEAAAKLKSLWEDDAKLCAHCYGEVAVDEGEEYCTNEMCLYED